MINSPIIPTFITVHIGAPEEAGRNINVPFVEYIKNVAREPEIKSLQDFLNKQAQYPSLLQTQQKHLQNYAHN